MNSLAGPSSKASRESALSLGLVNDLEEDVIGDEDEPRQVAGDELVSSSSKWHKHTVKVFSLLKRSMAGTDDDEGSKPSHLSFDSLSKGSSRRTAAGVFFELLQLKTWDYIEIDQDESYGDIKVRFFQLGFSFTGTQTDSYAPFPIRFHLASNSWRIRRRTRMVHPTQFGTNQQETCF